MNLALIGYRGTGKSAVARLLGLRLGWQWIDADVEIELRAGKSIAKIFSDDGEAAFRDWESQVLADLTSRQELVIACGGGAILRPENRRRLRARARVVWLRASPAVIVARLRADAATASRRPPLTLRGTELEVEDVLKLRTPLYQECAEIEVDTDDRTVAEVADEILHRLNQDPLLPESA